MAGDDHVLAGDVQGVALPGVETSMLAGRDVLAALDVLGPADGIGVLRPGHHESSSTPGSCRVQHEPLEHGLTVLAVRAEVSEIPAREGRLRVILVRVHGAMQSPGVPGAITVPEEAEHRARG